ncbi:hypothetical protein ACJIZ3_016768 [Penstemon smallii]|uniref:Late embryogenesis abundant protein LEA-2 subgroup domain-containing protein n=1 Tax=Penstemon smallii TaxID=265156 RepID=A0ABD3SUD6_9LAMI
MQRQNTLQNFPPHQPAPSQPPVADGPVEPATQPPAVGDLEDLRSHDHTHPFYKCVVIIASLLATLVIIASIVVCIGYNTMKPKVPQIIVTRAKLDSIDFNKSNLLLTLKVSLVMTAENANLKSRVSFYDTSFGLNFNGHRITMWAIEPFGINANSSVVINYTSQPMDIHLNAGEDEYFVGSIEVSTISVELKGNTKTRWRLGKLGPIKFRVHLNCQLLLPVD